MAGVFDIELHEGDSVNQDESDDDILESGEVRILLKHLIHFLSTMLHYLFVSLLF